MRGRCNKFVLETKNRAEPRLEEKEMTLEWVETVGHGLFKNHKNRKEKIIRITKTLVVTEFGRYDKKTGADVDATNKTVGGFKLSEESKSAVKDSQ